MELNLARRFNLILPVIFLLCAAQGHAQWQRVTSLSAASTMLVEMNAEGVLCCVPYGNDGLYISTDGGDSWTHQTDLEDRLIRNVELSRGDLLIHIGDSLFVRDGLYGPLAGISSPRDGKIGTFCTDDAENVYVTLVGNPLTDSVYVSSDRGISWQPLTYKFSDDGKKNALLADAAGNLWSHDLYNVGCFNIDTGQWEKLSGLGFRSSNVPRIFPDDRGHVYINCEKRIVKHDIATNVNHELFAQEPGSYAVLEFWPTAAGPLLLSYRQNSLSRGMLLRSTDDGVSWSVVDSLLPTQLQFIGEYDGWLYCSTWGQILRTADLGMTFEDCTEGLYTQSVSNFEVRGARVHVMAMRYALSDDGGNTWEYPAYGHGLNPNELQVTADGVAYENRGWLRVSYDSLRTWEEPQEMEQLVDLLALDNVVLASFRDSTLRQSVDQGRTWDIVYRGSALIATLISDGMRIFGTMGDRLLMWDDPAAGWNTKPLPYQATEWNAELAVNDSVMLFSEGGALWTTSDRGDNWSELPLSIPGDLLRSLISSTDGKFAAISERTGNPFFQEYEVLLSLDNGESWDIITGNLPERLNMQRGRVPPCLGFTSPSRLLIDVDDRGLYVRDGLTSVETGVPTHPREPVVELWPTQARSRLNARIETRQDVTVRVHDLAGRQWHSFRASAGTGTHRLDISSWPPGQYYLSIEAEDGLLVRSFAVLR